MKLTVNLDDAADMKSAHALIGSILDEIGIGDDAPDKGAPSAAEVFVHAKSDAAAVFGAVPLSIPAPSSVAVAPLPTAPVVPLGTSVAPLPAAPAPAPYIAPAVHALHLPAAPGNPVGHGTTYQNGGVELDVRGFPWDERIHAGTKTKTAKNVWTSRRGTQETTTAAVENELRGRGFGVPASQQSAAPLPPATPSPAALPAAPIAAAVPVAPSAPAAPAPPQADPTDYTSFITRVVASANRGEMPTGALNKAIQGVGQLPQVNDPDLNNTVALQIKSEQNPHLIPAVWATLKAWHPAVK